MVCDDMLKSERKISTAVDVKRGRHGALGIGECKRILQGYSLTSFMPCNMRANLKE